jgi:hypothetical protein|eukprot:TRINITY_DN75872_c0_g1_i1.p2 TRINITY_DN75872_c0_g1~~TRINITY_DN75872_c0_g1_i1.p2  ORF type:complete len:113 (-),score=34.51 TRINITY_DN75872_c0_g1_i1:100-438(-)
MPVTGFKVPTSTVASLIGSKGQKVGDINKSSGASVSFDTTHANSMFTTAYIHGSEEQTRIAVAIIKISVLHARAADFEPAQDEDNKDLVKNVEFDLNTFAVETAHCAFSSQD